MVSQEGAVYCTLLLSDNYLPGAVVLAHSLRDNGTHAKLVALYTPESLKAATINELQTVYDVLIPVHPMTNQTPANLWLMDRPDLIATFTKIELWRQTQFKRIVYIDCDVVALRAPDELFDLEAYFAAAPDVGWPDCFNSGVMVLRPNLEDYFALKALAERGISFDGADQGLLNMHFRDWHRLSFTYNCTPSANYQYIPAFKHFQSTINLIHFIGAQKPWNMPRQISPFDSPYNQLLGRWWTIYDRHYRPAVIEKTYQQPSQPLAPQSERTAATHGLNVEYSHTPVSYRQSEETPPVPLIEIQPPQLPQHQEQSLGVPQVSQPAHHVYGTTSHEATHVSHFYGSTDVTLPPNSGEPAWPTEPSETEHHPDQHMREPILSAVPQYVRGEEHIQAYIHQAHTRTTNQSPWEQDHSVLVAPLDFPEPSSAQVYPHQTGSGTEGVDVQQRSPSPPPPPATEAQPSFEPPRAEWDASREPPPLNSKPEGIALEKKTYNMSEDNQLFQPPASYPEAPKDMYYEVPARRPEPQKIAQLFPWEGHAPKPTRVFLDDPQHPLPRVDLQSSLESAREESGTSTESMTSWTSDVPSDPWVASSESFETYSRSNAWDEVPEIQKYIQSIQQSRKGRVQVISGSHKSTLHRNEPSISPLRSGVRVTDFPSETERPSLPVTPVPIRRPSATHALGEQYNTDELPAAEGVPNQEDWNPSTRLEELRQRQSEVLDNPDLIFDRLIKALKERD